MKFLNIKHPFKTLHLLLIPLVCILLHSCSKLKFWETEHNNLINLKWNKAYKNDNLELHKAGLKWALSFLGSKIALDTSYSGITYSKNTILLDVDHVGFSKKAITHLKALNKTIKTSDEYQKKGHIDIGRYLALTIGSPLHYYKIVDVPITLKDLESNYNFDTLTAYINNSSISKIDRNIKTSKTGTSYKKAFISSEIDTLTQKILEYESVELMENGLSRFALYDSIGNLKSAGDLNVTRAGKPGKCMWCHESGIQPLFRVQKEIPHYMSPKNFLDSLITYNSRLQDYQAKIWQDSLIINKRQHTNMELTYITFMEPSIEQLSNEWGLPPEKVRQKVKHLTPHTHEEFKFLGDSLYHRKNIDILAPYKVIAVPESIRESSTLKSPVNYLK